MNWNGNQSGNVNTPNTNPYAPCYSQPSYQQSMPGPTGWPAPGSFAFGMDPNPMFTAAINRLAAAIEKFNARGDGGTLL